MWFPGGACMVSQGACVAKGGACVAKGACMAKGGHAWYAHTPPTRYGWSMRGRYASYWKAFLFPLPETDSDSDLDSKPYCYIVLCRNFSTVLDLDSDPYSDGFPEWLLYPF